MKDLQKLVVELLPSASLKNEIQNTNFELSEYTLFATIMKYSPDYNKRLEYLDMLSTADVSEDVKVRALLVIREQNRIFEEFKAKEANTVYELRIKPSYNTYEERYLCDTYDNALKMIPKFFDEYECEETDTYRYEITKRRILTKNFEEDYVSQLSLLPQKVLYRVDEKRDLVMECAGECEGCGIYCMYPQDGVFPNFTSDKDLVLYRENYGTLRHGVVRTFGTEGEKTASEIYILPLDSIYMRYHDFAEAHYSHCHISISEVEKATLESAIEPIRDIYFAYLAYLEEHPDE